MANEKSLLETNSQKQIIPENTKEVDGSAPTEKKQEVISQEPEPEEKGKRLFFFQFYESFFESEEITIIRQIAEDYEFNENDCIVFWLKLMAKSLSTDGIIERASNLPITPRFLKSYLNFNFSSNDKNYNTNDFIHDMIVALEEEKLLTILSSGSIYISCVEKVTLSKSEAAEKMKLWRARKEIQLKEIQTIKNDEVLPDDIKFYNFVKKSLAGLSYKGFCKPSEEKVFTEILKGLWVLDKELIEYAIDDFITNKLQAIDYKKIVDRPNYFKITIENLLKEKHHVYFQIKKSKIYNSEQYEGLKEIANTKIY